MLGLAGCTDADANAAVRALVDHLVGAEDKDFIQDLVTSAVNNAPEGRASGWCPP